MDGMCSGRAVRLIGLTDMIFEGRCFRSDVLETHIEYIVHGLFKVKSFQNFLSIGYFVQKPKLKSQYIPKELNTILPTEKYITIVELWNYSLLPVKFSISDKGEWYRSQGKPLL